ncbi:ferritin family protein [Methanolobus sp. ZRKC3]|uniref:ferritin family protein n=1 Tax=Methanolobus sp. ZRKC3 TaxID=3125786 RepID=UPI00324E809C
MLSKIPIDLSKVNKKDIDKEILRAGIIAELDAVSLYEQMAELTDNPEVKRVLLDVAKEEKTHVGEFQTLLLERDTEQVEELEAGKKEVDEELGR